MPPEVLAAFKAGSFWASGLGADWPSHRWRRRLTHRETPTTSHVRWGSSVPCLNPEPNRQRIWGAWLCAFGTCRTGVGDEPVGFRTTTLVGERWTYVHRVREEAPSRRFKIRSGHRNGTGYAAGASQLEAGRRWRVRGSVVLSGGTT